MTPRLSSLAVVVLASALAVAWPGSPALAAEDDPPALRTSVERRPVPTPDAIPAMEEGVALQRSGRQGPRPVAREPAWFFHGIGFVGLTQFAAKDTFEAIFGSAGGTAYGGGVRVAHRSGLFGQVDVSRLTLDGERVFVSGGQVFKLGIPTRLTLTPIEMTGGYRYVRRSRPTARPGQPRPAAQGRARQAFVPYVGGGIGRVLYKETADFARTDDDTEESFRSYHFVGGVDVPVWRWIAAGVDVSYRWVPDALGQDGASKEFGDTDLGGTIIRFRLVVGR